MSARPEHVHAMAKAHYGAMRRDTIPPAPPWDELDVVIRAKLLIAMDSAFEVFVSRITPKINAVFDDAVEKLFTAAATAAYDRDD